MATDGEWGDFFEELFEPDPQDYADILFGSASEVDAHAQDLFSEWMASGFQDQRVLQELDAYMWEEYGIDFEDVFEWQDFQEWYDSQ